MSNWICDHLPARPGSPPTCQSIRDIVEGAGLSNITPSAAFLATAAGIVFIALIVAAVSLPGTAVKRWAQTRNVGPMDQVLISWAATILIGLPLAATVLTVITHIPSIPGQLATALITGAGLVILPRKCNRRCNGTAAETPTATSEGHRR